MRAFHLDRFQSLEGLVLRERGTPRPGPHEVLVRIRAASVNYRDVMVLRQTYPVPSPPGTIALSDGAGEVVEVGEGVTRVARGDRVAGTYFVGWIDGRLTYEQTRHQLGSSHDGMLADYRVLHEEQLVRVPRHLSFVEAATLPCAALTAWSGINGPRALLPGETVLVLGSGGVALFAMQFAQLFGARTIVVTSTADKADRLRALGATHAIARDEVPEWDARVRELTDGRGADHVVEAIGPSTLARSIQAGAFDAQIALMGVFGSQDSTLPGSIFNGRLLSLRRIAVGSRAMFEAMNRAIEAHRLRPVIDRVFAFDEAREAYRHFDTAPHFGKVVIDIE